ncbi:MAG: GNAT family N-acetyltransferase [Acidobacteriota bacterium]|nr:GNAT family N-acetyltransferase [Acidobacteriota bacterium]
MDETYGGLWAPPPIPIDEEDWSLAWVAIVNDQIAGIALTHDEWISDLWVLSESRGRGIGRQLLMKAEAEIIDRGHRTLRLRVIKSNTSAIRFYHRQGWQSARGFPHEKFPVTIIEMVKSA